MKKKLLFTLLCLLILLLEWHPAGVALRFANPEGEPWISTYSHFDLTPFGYANVFPFLTAMVSLFLSLITGLEWFWESRALARGRLILSSTACLFSLGSPLLFGWEYLTPAGVALFLILGLFVAFSALFFQGENANEDSFKGLLMLLVILAAKLLLPLFSLVILEPMDGLGASLFYFFLLYPALSAAVGYLAGKRIGRFWYFPLLTSVIFHGSALLLYDTAFPLLYALSYGGIAALTMIITFLFRRKKEGKRGANHGCENG